MFVNYFKESTRSSPINLAVARVLLGVIAIWRLLTIADWSLLSDWPVYLNTHHMFLLLSERYMTYLPVEKWITVLFLLLFVVGYRIGVTSFVSAFLMAHMYGILYMINDLHESTFASPFIVLILVFGLFRNEDKLSIDGFRRNGKYELREVLTRSGETYEMNALKWCLILFSIFWFLTGFSKIIHGPISDWVLNFNLLFKHYQLGQVPAYADFRILAGNLLVEYYWISVIAGMAAILLEVSILLFVLSGLPITPVLVATMGFVSIIGFTMNPFFFEMISLPFLFFKWDTLYFEYISRIEWL